MTRRTWIQTVAAAIGAATTNAGQAQPAPIGVELYTVRDLLPGKPDETLRALAEIGYREVEGSRSELVTLLPLLRRYHLSPVSCHIETPLITGNWDLWIKAEPATRRIGLTQALDSAAGVRARYFVLAYLRQEERGQGDDFNRLADKMNAVGEKCRQHGLQFCYHNHAFEFRGERGKRPIDILLRRLDPKLVGLEIDVFWVSTAGNDPVEFLKANAGRVPVVHLKDKRPGTPVQFVEDAVKPESFTEVGSGSLDIKAILNAAVSAGVRHYFVEQDHTPGNPIESLRKSYIYLAGLRGSMK